MRKVIGAFLTLFLLFGAGTVAQTTVATAQTEPTVKVQVDGWLVNFPDAQPFVDAATSRTLVPVRFVAEQLKSDVQWDQQQKLVTITKDDKKISLRVGEKVARVNGEVVTFDVKAIVKDDRTYVPLRFISKSFGASVNWQAADRLVVIDTTGQTPEQEHPAQPPSSETPPPADGVVPPPDWAGRDARNDVEDTIIEWEDGGCLFCDPNTIVKN